MKEGSLDLGERLYQSIWGSRRPSTASTRLPQQATCRTKRDYGTLFSSLVKFFLVNFHWVSLREDLITYLTIERSLLCVTAPVDISLSCSPEALATLEAGEWLWSTVHSLVDCLLASLAKTFGTESTLEWLWVAMHATVTLKTAPTTQNLSYWWVVHVYIWKAQNFGLLSDLIAHTAFEHLSCLPLCRFLLEPGRKHIRYVPNFALVYMAHIKCVVLVNLVNPLLSGLRSNPGRSGFVLIWSEFQQTSRIKNQTSHPPWSARFSIFQYWGLLLWRPPRRLNLKKMLRSVQLYQRTCCSSSPRAGF